MLSQRQYEVVKHSFYIYIFTFYNFFIPRLIQVSFVVPSMKVNYRIYQGKLLHKILPETQRSGLRNPGVVERIKPFKNKLSW